MQILKRFTLIAALLMMIPVSRASHLIGGHIAYEHISGNSFEVTVRLWRDMSGIALPGSVSLAFYENVAPYNAANIFSSNSTNITSLPQISTSQVVLGDSCYSPTGLDIEEGIYQATLTIPNNPNGYYMIYDDCCRNGAITNIQAPSSAGFSLVTEMPDPALGNSSPDIGPYPSDGYFCADYVNFIQEMAAVDPDGDSLVYSLVTPLDDGNPIKPFTNVNWLAPYSLADIVGGPNPMYIDSATGMIVAEPTLLGGVFVFSVQVEEYRNGVKIGEVRSDVQYQVLNCQLPGPPELVEMSNIDTTMQGNIQYTSYIMEVPVGVDTCTDVVLEAIDTSDILFVMIDSSTSTFLTGPSDTVEWNQGPLLTTNPDTTRYYTIWDPNANQYTTDTIVGQSLTDSGFVRNVHRVGYSFCYQLACGDLDSLYWIDFLIIPKFADSCADAVLDTVYRRVFFRPYLPPDNAPVIHGLLDDYQVEVKQHFCIDMLVYDDDEGDSLYVSTESNTFGRGAAFKEPNLVNGYYESIIFNDTFYVSPQNLTPEGDFVNTDSIALKYCWQTECQHLHPGDYVLALEAWSMDFCKIDTNWAFDTTVIHIYPLPGEQNNIPNVFTPNGDGSNDVFTIDGISDPCADSITAKIYNRWGQMVFESTDPYFEWDGTNKAGNPLPEGTYYLILEGNFGGPNSPADRQYPITLFR